MAVQGFTDAFIALPDGAGWPDTPTERWIDLSTLERNCDDTGFGLVDSGASIDFGDDSFEDVELSSAKIDGDRQVAARHRSRIVTIPLLYKGEAGQALADLRRLGEAVWRRGILVFQLEGEAEPEYWDFVKSPTAEALTGRSRDLFRITQMLMNEQGWPLRLKCYPNPRTAPVVFGPFDITNAVDDREFQFTNPGNRYSECRVETTPDAGSVGEYRYGIRLGGALAEYRTKYSHALSTANLKIDTSSVAVTDAEGGFAADCDFATQETLARRLRKTITLTDAAALEGFHKVFLRHRARAGSDGTSRFRVQIRYGFTSADLVMQTLGKVEFDWRDVDTPNWITSPMGNLKVPKGATQVILEVWAARLAGNQHLAFDATTLMPEGEMLTTVGIPGHRMGEWGHDRFDSDQIDGTGNLKRGTYRLNAQNEYGEVISNVSGGGFLLPAGVHVVRVDCWLREYEDNSITSGPNPPELVLAELQIIQDSDDTVRKRIKLRTKDNHVWTHVQREVAFNVTAADVLASERFRYHVEFTAADQAGRQVRIESVEHRFLEGITSSTALVLDSMIRRAFVMDSATEGTLFSVMHENELPLCPPGEQVWVNMLHDIATDPGYQDVDKREPVMRSVGDRAASVLIKIWPRQSH